MLSTLKQVFNPSNKDIKKKLYFTLLLLLIFKIGTTIRVPGTSDITSDLGLLELLSVIGGGSLEKFSIFSLGVMPYISASIIIQLLQMDIIPYFSELSKQGAAGRMKINRITRYIGIGFAFVQGYFYAHSFIGSGAGPMQYIEVALILTAGTAFLLWLGDQITQKGIGNGISIIIMAGIVSNLPIMFSDAFNGLVDLSSQSTLFIGVISFALFVIVYLAIIVGVIFIQEAERRIPIQYSNRTRGSYNKEQNYMPFKINSAGVIPVIFGSALLMIPALLSTVINNAGFSLFVTKYLSFNSTTGIILYLISIIIFSYFYTFLQIKPDELSTNLQKQGGYIPGIRPGNETAAYIKQVLYRLTFVGSIFLMVIAFLPTIFSTISSLPTSVKIGGTGLLIVVGVALETFEQLESQLISRSYKRGRKL